MATTTVELFLVPGTTTVYAEAAGGSGTAAASYTATQIAGYLHSIDITEALTGRWMFKGGDTNGSFGYRLLDNLTDTATTFEINDPDTAELEDLISATILQSTTIDTVTSQTEFTLSAGSSDDDAYNGATIVVTDADDETSKAVGTILDYVGSTKTVTLVGDPGIFTMASGDAVKIVTATNAAPAGPTTSGWIG